MTFLKQSKELHISLTQIWVGLLGLRLPPSILSKSITNTYLVNIWYQDPLNFAEVSILGKSSTSTQGNNVRAVWNIF